MRHQSLGATRRRAAASVVAVVVMCAAVLAPSANAAVTIRGQITCAAYSPMGAWQTVNNGGSGWVGWNRITSNTMNYSRTFSGGSWYLAVGCGGSTSSWKVTTYTNTYSGGGNFNFTCYDIRNAGYAYGRCQLT